MSTPKAQFIVLYGVNNLGKSTQAKLLSSRFQAAGLKAEYIKYPVYDIEPSGKILNNYLRGGNTLNLSPREAQIIYTLNRTQTELMIMQKLDDGISIIAEDYTGTGLAWGIGTGVNENFLRTLNSHLLKEDIAFLLDGERFIESTEKNHKHETQNDLSKRVRQIHLQLAREFNWRVINANQKIPNIHTKIWDTVHELLKKSPPIQTASNHIKPQETKTNTTQIKIPKSEIKSAPPETTIQYQEPKPTPPKPETQSIMQLKVEQISPLTKLPTRAHPTDAGLDIYSSEYQTFTPGDRQLVKTGIKMAIPKGYAGLVWDKSGIAKQGIRTMAGVIDSSYRGEILVNLINLSNNIYTITPGQKIAQILIQKIETPEIIKTTIETDTDRGENGFGSTGL